MRKTGLNLLSAGLLLTGAVHASDMFVGWTRTSVASPTPCSLKLPGLAGFSAQLVKINPSGNGNKWGRGCSDLSFGSQYPSWADEVGIVGSTSTFSIVQTDALQIVVTNNAGAGGLVVFDSVMVDSTAPWGTSAEILRITYKEGGVGLMPGTVVGLWTNIPGSGLTGFDDYADFDADLTVFPESSRILSNGQYAVFEITVSGGTGETYVDNIAVGGSYNPPPSTAGTISVVIDASAQKGTISPYLVGAHTVYYNDKDAAYADGTLATWFKNSGVGTMRFPGGSVVKYWDWESPSGTATGDPWDPAWDGVVANSNDWMSLDEYLDFCDISEIMPLVGVNYRSGYLYDRVQDSIDRAARCVQYVVDRGYSGAFYYIGNEDMYQVGGPESAAHLFVQHAQAMKAIDPTIKIFWNDNGADPQRMKDYLAIAGEWADGYEFHGKWPFGGSPDPSPLPGSYEEWKTEVPLIDRKADNNAGKTWRQKIADLRQAAIEAGYPDLLLANNEYGWGSDINFSGFNKYTSGLMMIDFLQEHFISGYDMACFWANIRSEDNGLLDDDAGYRKNPQTLGWELLSEAQGATLIDSSTTHSNVYGFAAVTIDQILLYLINKTEFDQHIEVSFAAFGADTNELATGVSLVDSMGQWGTNQLLVVNYNVVSNTCTAVLPALSYSRISFVKSEYGMVGWDAGQNGAPDHSTLPLTATLAGGDTGDWGSSDDQTWGNLSMMPRPETNNSSFKVKDSYEVILSLENSTGGDLLLDGIYLDYNWTFAGGPQHFSLEYTSGSLGNSSYLLYETSATDHLYHDYDFPFVGLLTNRVLVSGQSAVFTLLFTGGTTSRGELDNLMLRVRNADGGYDAWASLYSLAGEPNDNDDGDSLDNFAEYGLGGDPTNPVDIGILPTFGNAGGGFEYIYPCRTTPGNGLAYLLETTDDLVSGVWTNAGYAETGIGIINDDFKAVTNDVPTLGKTTGFIRLKIWQ